MKKIFTDNTINSIKEASECKELPLRMRAMFYMPILKKNCNYYELLESSEKFAEATVTVISYDESDTCPVMIISGYNGKYQDFYYDGCCWKLLSNKNPIKDWEKKGLSITPPEYLVNDFAKRDLVGFMNDAIGIS